MQQFQIKLNEEKELLIKELSTIGQQSPDGIWSVTPDNIDEEKSDKIDTADNMEELQTRKAVLETLKTRLKNVDEALERIINNTYGICKVGDDKHKIEEDRLEANPAATTCKEHLNS